MMRIDEPRQDESSVDVDDVIIGVPRRHGVRGTDIADDTIDEAESVDGLVVFIHAPNARITNDHGVRP